MRTLAQLDAGLQGYLYNPVNNTFRWFDTQQIQGYIKAGTCVSVMRVGTVPMYANSGMLATEQVRIQFDIRDLDGDKAKEVAAYIDMWLGTVSFFSPNQFDSPPAPPPSFPNFKLNQRNTTEFQVQPVLAWTSMLEYRIFNDLNF